MTDPSQPSTGQAPAPPAKRLPLLDARLRAAADWVPYCDVCADIGCDHGRFGAVLLAEGRCRHLIAADVSAKALAKARARLTWLGYAPLADFAVADGLAALADRPADTVCILGMGGDTLSGILRRGRAHLAGATLILSPQTDPDRVRAAVDEVGYRLTEECVVCADGRLYLLLKARPAETQQPPYSERELLLGPCLLRDHPPEWLPWLLRKQRLLTVSIQAMRATGAPRDAQRLAAACRELAYTEEALRAFSVAGSRSQTEGSEQP